MAARKRGRALTAEEHATLDRAQTRVRESVAQLGTIAEDLDRTVRDLKWAAAQVDDTIRNTKGGA